MPKVPFRKPGNFLYPVPAVLVSCRGKDGKSNILTVAWAGTVCSDPPMLSISVRRERHSYQMIHETREFTVNLTNEKLIRACDYCGCTSGAKVDKWKECALTQEEGEKIGAPSIAEAPVSIECRVIEEKDLGSHVLFLAEVLCVKADDEYMDEKGSFHLDEANLIVYSHGTYFALGKKLGTFGFSVRKKKKKRTNGSASSKRNR